MNPFRRRTMLPVNHVRGILQMKAEHYCDKLTFPESFERDGAGAYDPERLIHHIAARKAAKQFIPRTNAQLQEFIEVNDVAGHVVTVEDARVMIEALAMDAFKQQFAGRNAVAEQEVAKLKEINSEVEAGQKQMEAFRQQREQDLANLARSLADAPPLVPVDVALGGTTVSDSDVSSLGAGE